jgi:hypothetical protein
VEDMPRVIKTNWRNIPQLEQSKRDSMIKLPGNFDKLLQILPDDSTHGNKLIFMQL